MRVPFRQGLVKAGPSFLTISGNTASINVVDTPLVATIATGSKDYLWVEPQSVPNAWGPLSAQDTWLYIDINTRTAVRTFGTTTIAPVAASIAPSVLSVGAHWFDTSSHQMKVWSGTAWQVKTRVFVVKLANGSVIESLSINAPAFTGTQVGDTSESFTGQILFDLDDQPIKQTSGLFMTTEDRLRTRVLSTAELKLSSMQIEAQAGENLAKYSVVVFSDFGVIEHASLFSPSSMGQFGMIEQDTVTGDLVYVATSGVITNPDWDWTSVGVNKPLYCTGTGTLATTEQIPGQTPVAVIIDKHSIQLGSPQVTSGATNVGVATGNDLGLVRLNIAATNPADPIVVSANDPRLTNARTPTVHTHAISDVTGLQTQLDSLTSLTASIPVDAVQGPGSSVDGDIVRFNGITGKLIKGGIAITTATNLSGNSNLNIPTEAAVKAYVDAAQTAAQTFATSAANGAQTFATTAANNAQSAAQTFATTAANNAQSAAQTYTNNAIASKGDVFGPASAINSNIVLFSGTTGKQIKDSGIAITTSTTLAGNSNTNVPTEAAVKAYVDAKPTGSGDVVGPASSVDSRFVMFIGTTGKLVKDSGLLLTTSTTLAGNSDTNVPSEKAVKAYADAKKQSIPIAASDETTALATGTAKVTFRMPYAFTLTSVKASLTTAQATGVLFTVNIKKNGTTIFSTKITFDNTSRTTVGATTPAVLSITALADDDEITVDIDQVGDGTAKGLKIYLIGTV